MRILDVLEARKTGKEYSYSEKKAKGILDKVILELTGKPSEVFSKMGKQYKQIDNLIDALEQKRERLNDQAKGKIQDLFDAGDEVFTRVISTALLTLTMSKETTRDITSTTFDYDGFFQALLEMLPKLTDQLEELRKAYTLTEKETKKTPPRLSVRYKDTTKESLEEGVGDKLKEFTSLFKRVTMLWCKRYDKELNKIKLFPSSVPGERT